MNLKHINQAKPHCDNCVKIVVGNRFQKKVPSIRKESALTDLLSKAIQGNE